MRLRETTRHDTRWVRRDGKHFIAEVSFSWPTDSALFVDQVSLRREVRLWLEEVCPRRYIIHTGSISLPRVLFLEMNDAIHFKLRWS